MEKYLIKYIIAILILFILYNLIPKNKLPIDDIYLFIALGLFIFGIFNNIIQPIIKYEHYKNVSNKSTEVDTSETFDSITINPDTSTAAPSTSIAAPDMSTAAPAPTPSVNTGIPNINLNNVTNQNISNLVQIPSLTPSGAFTLSSPSPAPSPVSSQLNSLTLDQIKALSEKDRDQLVQSYLVDLYKNTIVGSNNKYVLTESEIVYYIGLFVSSFNDSQKMNTVRNNITAIQRVDPTRGFTLLKLMNLAQINPELSIRVASTAPLKLIDIVNAMDSSLDINNLIVNASNKAVELDLIKLLQTKINNLENTVKSKSDAQVGNQTIPDALMDIVSKNKYIDPRGVVQDLMYGDLKYNSQLTPGQMQPLGSYDNTFNNKWNNEYTLLNTDKWRPADRKVPVCKQEKQCPVCPTLTSGYPLLLKEYDTSRYVMGPDGISVDYINQLNNPIKS
jgi:hypothetical protein